MKILLTGGGTAGHFYPLIAIAEELRRICEEQKLLKPELFFMSTTPYDPTALFENEITFKGVSAGKARIYFSLLNLIDLVKVGVGIIRALITVYFLYPDVVVSKGGYGSIPAVVAARILRIPIIIHESDAAPGRANLWASKFAERIAVSWPEAAPFFPKEKTAITGHPVRRAVMQPEKHGAFEYLHLEKDVPVIFILGGSQGAQHVNDMILEILPQLLSKYQVIHQVGLSNSKEVKNVSSIVLAKTPYGNRYKIFGYLNNLAMQMSAGVTTLVISRAGSTIFEIAAWGLPSILIPITESNGDHQRKNAYAYAREGAAIVIEEKSMTSSVLLSEIEHLMADEATRTRMQQAARQFFKPGAAEKIAREVIRIALGHER
ncbi:MAG TPA: UDP-N-acetylglucosamine--N-acetylmuramyl-(pentapeptide) pyrophosphoryl-undecaprenol N-acetylglucosamine transferase [Candidatus Paceibacterota bacterium]